MTDRAPPLACVAALAALMVRAPAQADRAVHGSVGGGSALLVTGHDDDRLRYELELDVEPRSRHGVHAAWRGFSAGHRGMALAGVTYEAAASRPRLVLDLHADLGADLDQRAPVTGGGVRTTIAVWGPLGVALDGGAYLVLDGVERTRLRIAGSTSLVARW